MTGLAIRTDEVLLDQIACIAQNLAHRDNKEVRISSFNDERYKDYEADIKAYERGELETFSLEELEKDF
ncbi:MAG: hypothetical protein SPF98_00415 [Campylobacter sp.]|nr:hypothetical protein [Campylobacter sp.]